MSCGRGSPEAPTALEVFDPRTKIWTRLASMPTGRSGIAAAVVNGELYVFGGEIPTLHGEVEVYNPSSNSWRRLANMPTPRHGIWASVIGTRIYLPGGGIDQGFEASSINEVFSVATKATFADISTRAKVETGDRVLIGGFIVSGSRSKRLLLHALGPSLPVAGALADPVLELHDSSGQLTAQNDNWRDAPNRQEIIDTGLPPSHDLEAAIVASFAPGDHTVILRGAANGTGIALVEAYDLEAAPDSELANISTRGFVQTGDQTLIGGVILSGHDARRVVVRALGPSLQVANGLPDPTLELRDGNGALVAANDNWRSAQQVEIPATGIPPANDFESAIVQTLSPANYTAIVRGAHEGIGVALVEAYALQ